MVTYGFLAFLICLRQPWRVRVPVLAFTTVAVAAIGLSRLYLGMHWLSDVAAGFALGLAWITLLGTAYITLHVPARLPAWQIGAVAAATVMVAVGYLAAFRLPDRIEQYRRAGALSAPVPAPAALRSRRPGRQARHQQLIDLVMVDVQHFKAEARHGDRFGFLRDALDRVDHKACHGIDIIFARQRIDLQRLLQVDQRRDAVHQPRAVVAPHDLLVFARVEDVAHQRADNIVKRDDADHEAVLVHHHGKALVHLAKRVSASDRVSVSGITSTFLSWCLPILPITVAVSSASSSCRMSLESM